jgi:hypothetical protein
MLSWVHSPGAISSERAGEHPAEIQFFRHEDAPRTAPPRANRRTKQPEIKVRPIARDGQPQAKPKSKLLVQTLIGIGMGVSMVFGTFVIIRNQQHPPAPPGPAEAFS